MAEDHIDRWTKREIDNIYRRIRLGRSPGSQDDDDEAYEDEYHDEETHHTDGPPDTRTADQILAELEAGERDRAFRLLEEAETKRDALCDHLLDGPRRNLHERMSPQVAPSALAICRWLRGVNLLDERYNPHLEAVRSEMAVIEEHLLESSFKWLLWQAREAQETMRKVGNNRLTAWNLTPNQFNWLKALMSSSPETSIELLVRACRSDNFTDFLVELAWWADENLEGGADALPPDLKL